MIEDPQCSRHSKNVSQRMYAVMKYYLDEQDIRGQSAWKIYYNAIFDLITQYFVAARPNDSPEQIKQLMMKESEFYSNMLARIDYSFAHPFKKKKTIQE